VAKDLGPNPTQERNRCLVDGGPKAAFFALSDPERLFLELLLPLSEGTPLEMDLDASQRATEGLIKFLSALLEPWLKGKAHLNYEALWILTVPRWQRLATPGNPDPSGLGPRPRPPAVVPGVANKRKTVRNAILKKRKRGKSKLSKASA